MMIHTIVRYEIVSATLKSKNVRYDSPSEIFATENMDDAQKICAQMNDANSIANVYYVVRSNTVINQQIKL